MFILTDASDAISLVALVAVARERTIGVGAAGVHVTVVLVSCALVDICVHADST